MMRVACEGGTSVANSVACRGVAPPFPPIKTINTRQNYCSCELLTMVELRTVPALVGSDEPKVFALGLGTFAHAPTNAALDLVRRTNTLVAFFQCDRH